MMEVETSKRSPSKHRGVLALLDLPPGTTLSIDGCKNLTLRQNDFVGIKDVPFGSCHFVAVCSGGAGVGTGSVSPQHAAGLIFLFRKTHSTDNDAIGSSDGLGHDEEGESNSWLIGRRYNSRTEELSSESLDAATCSNLLGFVNSASSSRQAHRIVPYQSLLSPQDVKIWGGLTDFVSESLLAKRGLRLGGDGGCKVVPGCYHETGDTYNLGKGNGKNVAVKPDYDGVEVSYPPIPCLDPGLDLSTNKHVGTRGYLSMLSPSERTELFVHINPSYKALQDVLRQFYDCHWEDLVGDMQLSFICFLHLGCLASFEHWRDLLSMLSFAPASKIPVISHHGDLYSNALRVIALHLQSIEVDFFEEVDYSANNFLVPALRRLCFICSNLGSSLVKTNLSELVKVAKERFNIALLSGSFEADGSDAGADETTELTAVNMLCSDSVRVSPRHNELLGVNGKSSWNACPTSFDVPEHSDDDGPVVVPFKEVETSLARSVVQIKVNEHQDNEQESSVSHRQAYPLLFAAMTAQEDVLMACSRILDDATDVSLVREAAAYLEDVEAKKDTPH